MSFIQKVTQKAMHELWTSSDYSIHIIKSSHSLMIFPNMLSGKYGFIVFSLFDNMLKISDYNALC